MSQHHDRSRWRLWVVGLTLLLPASLARGEAETLIAVDGDRSGAKLLRCEADGSWLFEIDGKTRDWTMDQLIRWGEPAKTPSGALLYLSDGNVLAVDESFEPLNIVGEQVIFDSTSLGEKIELPLSVLEGIVFRLPPDVQQRDQIIDRLRTTERSADTVLLKNGDELQGTIGGLSTTELALQIASGNTISVPRKNILAIALNPALLDRPKQQDRLLMVHLADGSRIIASDWKGDAEKVQLKTPSGLALKTHYRTDAGAANLLGLQSSTSHVVYLSDLEPADYRHRPYLSVAWPYRSDHNVMGTRLRSGGTLYEKGIGMHSLASLTYQFEEPYQRFDATLGIDDSAGNRGSVVFRLYVDDGSGKWQLRYQSDIIRGGDGTTPISIDLSGIRGLSLMVDYAERGDEMDRANWLDARLLPAKDKDR